MAFLHSLDRKSPDGSITRSPSVALILDIDLKLHGQPSVAGEVLIL
jgi:hypothetical protein